MLPARPVILLVEDDAPLRGLFRLALEMRGFHVEVAGDGVTALQIIEQAPPPHLAILDLNLPRLGGLAVAAELAANTSTSRIPLIVVTASVEPFDESRFAAVLRKPVAAEDVAVAAEQALRMSGRSA